MTGIYECRGKEAIDYYAIIKDGEMFRLGLVDKVVDGVFIYRGILTRARPKEYLIGLLENAYQTVTKVDKRLWVKVKE